MYPSTCFHWNTLMNLNIPKFMFSLKNTSWNWSYLKCTLCKKTLLKQKDNRKFSSFFFTSLISSLPVTNFVISCPFGQIALPCGKTFPSHRTSQYVLQTHGLFHLNQKLFLTQSASVTVDLRQPKSQFCMLLPILHHELSHLVHRTIW